MAIQNNPTIVDTLNRTSTEKSTPADLLAYIASRTDHIACPVQREKARTFHTERYYRIAQLSWAFVHAIRKGGLAYAFPGNRTPK